MKTSVVENAQKIGKNFFTYKSEKLLEFSAECYIIYMYRIVCIQGQSASGSVQGVNYIFRKGVRNESSKQLLQTEELEKGLGAVNGDGDMYCAVHIGRIARFNGNAQHQPYAVER